MKADEFYTENSIGELVVSKVIEGAGRTKLVEFYQDGNKTRTYRVISELFKNKKTAIKYFKS